MFYVSIPQVGPDKAKGALAEIDPKAGSLVKMLPVDNCQPAGLVNGPGDNLLLGCVAGDKDTGLPPQTVVMNGRTGAVVTEIPGIGGNDMVAYNPKVAQYYTASSHMPNGPLLGVIDANTNTLVQSLSLPGGNPHSVAASQSNNHVFVPLGVKGGRCGCCIAVFVPE